MIKNIKNKKNLIISHISDIDGVSAVVLAKIFIKNIDYILVELSELDSLIKEIIETQMAENYEVIYVTDLGFSDKAISLILKAPEFKNKIKHFDHHIIEERNNIYDFVNEVSKTGDHLNCGTSLFYDYLKLNYKNKLLFTGYFETFVEAVRCRDVWETKKNEFKIGNDLSTYFTIFGPEIYINHFLIIPKNTKEFNFIREDQTLIDNHNKAMANYISKMEKNMVIIDIDDYKVGAVIAENYRSELGDFLSNKYQDQIDFVLIANIPRMSCSLRGIKKNIHLGEISRKIDPLGGGHISAAGFPINVNTIWILEKIIDKLKSILL